MSSVLRKTWAVTKKELLHIVRSPGMLFLVSVSPIVMLVLMAYALAADISSVPVAVLDGDLSPLSRAYVRQIMGGPDLVLTGYVDLLGEVDNLLENNTIRAAIIIQPGFEENVTALNSLPVQVIVDGAEPTAGGFAFEHIVFHTQVFLQQQELELLPHMGLPASAMIAPIDLRMRVWYNPGLKAVQDVVPALIAVILSLPATSLSAAIAREKSTVRLSN